MDPIGLGALAAVVIMLVVGLVTLPFRDPPPPSPPVAVVDVVGTGNIVDVESTVLIVSNVESTALDE